MEVKDVICEKYDLDKGTSIPVNYRASLCRGPSDNSAILWAFALWPLPSFFAPLV
jgi:hypothetical protein